MGTSPNGKKDNQRARSAKSDGRIKPSGEASQPDWSQFALPSPDRSRSVLPIPDRPFTGLITGVPTAQREPADYLRLGYNLCLGYNLRDYDKSSRAAWKWLRSATAKQVTAQATRLRGR